MDEKTAAILNPECIDVIMNIFQILIVKFVKLSHQKISRKPWLFLKKTNGSILEESFWILVHFGIQKLENKIKYSIARLPKTNTCTISQMYLYKQQSRLA